MKLLPNIYSRWLYVALALIIIAFAGSFAGFKILQQQRAADGGGTASVTPTAIEVSAVDKTFNFTYTADTTKDSGSMTLQVPTGVGWSQPQGTGGTAGYTTATSTGGIIGDVEDDMDSPLANWSNTQHQALSITAGSGAALGFQMITNTITQYTGAGETWHYNIGASENWGQANAGSNMKIGMFMDSDQNLTAGDLSWQDDDNNDLASPEHTTTLPAFTAGVGKYISVALAGSGGTDVSGRNSYGYEHTVDPGTAYTAPAVIRATHMAPLFDSGDGGANWGSTANATAFVSGLPPGDQQEGSNYVQCSFTGAATFGDGCYRSNGFAPFTIGPGTTVGFWVRPSVNVPLVNAFQWEDDGNINLGSPEDVIQFTGPPGGLVAGTWSYVKVTAPASNNKNVTSYGITLNFDVTLSGIGPFTLDIDAMGKVINLASTTTNWDANVIDAFSLLADAGTKRQGTNSMSAAVDSAATAGEYMYRDVSAEDWSGYTQVGFWIRSTVATSAGDLHFQFDNSTGLTSPIGSLPIPALSANTWTWQILDLTCLCSLSTINSFGIEYNVDIGAATLNTDYFLLGPGVPTFDVNTIGVNFLDIKSADTVEITYGDGGGTSGVDVPTSAGSHTFTVKNRDASDGTLTTLINASPVIIVNTQPTISAISDTPDPIVFGNDIAFEANWADNNSPEEIKMVVCRTNVLSFNYNCAVGETLVVSSTFETTDPRTESYTTTYADIATSPNSYYIFVCDIKDISNSCSVSSAGTFTVEDQILSLTTDASNLTFGTMDYTAARYANTSLGSATEVQGHMLTARSNAGNGYSLTVRGDTLKSGTNSITAIGGTSATSAPGTEQFGLRAEVLSGLGTITAPYGTASEFAYGATPTVPDEIASTTGADTEETQYSLRYIANIQKSSEVGDYSTTLTYILTPPL